MPIAVLFPSFTHAALEERYASWQSQMLLRREHPHLVFWHPGDAASAVASELRDEFVLVVTDPLMLPSPRLGALLEQALGDAFAAVPGVNAGGHPRQQVSLRPYMTLREFEHAAREVDGERIAVRWESHDPGVFLCATETLRGEGRSLEQVLQGRDVVIEQAAVVHRWASLRGQVRLDLLERISPDARSILEFGCGESPLGEALKRRQACRVVGLELDEEAAAIARKRIDEVHCGDARQIVSTLGETFDWIVGGDIVEHLDEPWTFLAALRRVSAPGGRLLLSIPNVANGSIVADLLHGRFDYVYMGLTCVGHLRFFTRRTLQDMLTIAGWELVSMEPQSLPPSPEQIALFERMRGAGIAFDPDEVTPSGYYVTARNPS